MNAHKVKGNTQVQAEVATSLMKIIQLDLKLFQLRLSKGPEGLPMQVQETTVAGVSLMVLEIMCAIFKQATHPSTDRNQLKELAMSEHTLSI